MTQKKIEELEKIIAEEYGNTAGIVVYSGEKKLYENYYNGCTGETALHVFSVTKSIFSSLMGIAIEKGFIESVNQRVLEFFPDYKLKRGEKTLPQIRIEDLLTMTVPYKFKSQPYTKYFSSESWVKTALDFMGGKGTIGQFRYAPLVGPDVLSGILTKATGMSTLRFARENLFEPLGIDIKDNVVFYSKEEQIDIMKNRRTSGWVADPMGVNTVGWGIFMTTLELAKIGRLYLQRGCWEDCRIVPEKWIDESTREHSHWGSLGYGYLWWAVDEKERTFAALGDGGNTIYVNGEKNLVVCMSGLFKPGVKDRIGLIKDYVEPLFAPVIK